MLIQEDIKNAEECKIMQEKHERNIQEQLAKMKMMSTPKQKSQRVNASLD